MATLSFSIKASQCCYRSFQSVLNIACAIIINQTIGKNIAVHIGADEKFSLLSFTPVNTAPIIYNITINIISNVVMLLRLLG